MINRVTQRFHELLKLKSFLDLWGCHAWHAATCWIELFRVQRHWCTRDVGSMSEVIKIRLLLRSENKLMGHGTNTGVVLEAASIVLRLQEDQHNVQNRLEERLHTMCLLLKSLKSTVPTSSTLQATLSLNFLSSQFSRSGTSFNPRTKPPSVRTPPLVCLFYYILHSPPGSLMKVKTLCRAYLQNSCALSPPQSAF